MNNKIFLLCAPTTIVEEVFVESLEIPREVHDFDEMVEMIKRNHHVFGIPGNVNDLKLKIQERPFSYFAARNFVSFVCQ